METATSILTTQHLSIGYHNQKNTVAIAKQINIALAKGALVGLVGANGSGKSTLLRTLSKMQPALQGDININKRQLKTYSYQELSRQLSVVLTEPPASKNLTVQELVALGRQPYTNWLGSLTQSDKEHVNNALLATETMALQHQKCYALSDGQLQRVMIARALAQDTPLILLDEPTTHLDIYHRASVLKLLKQLSKTTAKTILFSTHEIDMALQLCDQIIVMNNGNAVIDSPKNLIHNGHIEALFPKELIRFDKTTGRFRVDEENNLF